MQGDNDRRKTSTILIAVTGNIILLVSFILPWWGLHQGIDGTASRNGFGVSISSGISYQGSGTGFYIGGSTSIVYITAAVLIILALICSTVMVAASTLSLINNKVNPKLPLRLGVMALVFCLLAPIIFMIALPMAMKADAEQEAKDSGDDYTEPDHDDPTKSFFGSYEEDSYVGTVKRNWGGDIGWVLSFFSFVFLVISTIMIRPMKTVTAPPQLQTIAPYQPQIQMPQQVPAQQPPPQVRRGPPPPPPPRKTAL